MVKYEDVIKSIERIGKYISETPLDYSIGLSDESTKVFLKLENQQKQKTFKVRGALSKLSSLTEEEKIKGVVAVSSGNHGAGVSYAAMPHLCVDPIMITVQAINNMQSIISRKKNPFNPEVVHHSPEFQWNDQNLKISMLVMSQAALDYLTEDSIDY
ncbi:MAG: Pyridoxal-5'-phosphate-dependent protein, beta subunit [Clostridiales bacterium 38_11]|nr:MAG: Pyridoxal-5'-phosphate-dependent protein, beta subunit [Clostridiales bacterium 38_11]HBH13008.1 hypothetical protein [Clostridiales bacterium]